MRKPLLFFLALILILLLAACSKKATPTVSEPPYMTPTPTVFKQALPLQGDEGATPGAAHPTESPLPTPVSPLPTPTPSPTS